MPVGPAHLPISFNWPGPLSSASSLPVIGTTIPLSREPIGRPPGASWGVVVRLSGGGVDAIRGAMAPGEESSTLSVVRPAAVPSRASAEPFPPLYRLVRGACAPVLRRLFDLRVEGAEHLPASGSFILAAIQGTYEALRARRFYVPRRRPLSVRFGAPLVFDRPRHRTIARAEREDVTRRIMSEIAGLLHPASEPAAAA